MAGLRRPLLGRLASTVYHRLALASRRKRIVRRADRVLLPDLPVLTLNDQLAATIVFEVTASGVNGLTLSVVNRTRA
jgi:hypothetical protein